MKKKVLDNLLQYCIIVLAAVTDAFVYILLIIKNNFAPAGVNGIAVMLQYKLNFSLGYFSLLLNIPLCVLAYFFINKRFAVNTFVFNVVYSGTYLLLQQLDMSRFQYDAQGVDTIYPVLFAGVLAGICCAAVFLCGGSTGGTDFLAKFINKHRPQMNFFWINFAINGTIAAASYFVYAQPDGSGGLVFDLKPVCLCIFYCFTLSFMANTVIRGRNTAYKFTITTVFADEIEREIIEKLNRTATRFAATGAYTHMDKAVLTCVVTKHQLIEMKSILKNYSDTFTYVEPVYETLGNFRH